jgi:hypothetical protein
MNMQENSVQSGHGPTILPAVAVAGEVAAKQAIVPAHRGGPRHVRQAAELLVQGVKDAAKNGTWLEARWLGGGT